MKKLVVLFAVTVLGLALTAADYVFIVSDKSVNESRSGISEGADIASGTLSAADVGSVFDSRVWTKAISEMVDLDSRKFYGSFLIVRSFYSESRLAKRSSVDGWEDPRNGLRVACRAGLR
jgi:hypothetical protein